MLHQEYPFEGKVNYLFLDFNCAIHPAVKKDPTLSLDKMYPAVLTYLESIVKFTDPQEGIYIAIDGVAPRAKMEQQRSRRHKSVKEAKLVREIKKNYGEPTSDPDIDFNMISPGTEFMTILSSKIVQYIKEKKKREWRDLEIHFSDSTVPGEGEHKIMDFIRKHPDLSNVAIYGLDSDLIFLSLLNCPKKTVLVRETMQFGRVVTDDLVPYTYMSIDHLKDCLIKVISPLVSFAELEGIQIFNNFQYEVPIKPKYSYYRGTDADNFRLIIDYVFCCFLLGNDFIPHMPSLKIREGGLNTVIQAYKIVSWQLGSYLVNEDRISINQRFLSRLLEALALVEDDFLLHYNKSRAARIEKFHRKLSFMDPMERELAELEYVENKYRDPILMGEEGWRIRYYAHHFHIPFRHKGEFSRMVLPICHRYLEGVKWSLLYYQGLHNNWTWHYDFCEAPSVLDLSNSLSTIDFNSISFEDSGPVMPFVQLMCILPPESSKLLPSELALLMTARDSELHFMYPLKIEMDIVGKKFLWECSPLLPEIDLAQINEIVSKITDQCYVGKRLDLEKRNSHGETMIF